MREFRWKPAKALLGHASGDITTHYSAAELSELMDAAEKVTDRGARAIAHPDSDKAAKEKCRKTVEMRGKVSGC